MMHMDMNRMFKLYLLPALLIVMALTLLPAAMSPYLNFFGVWTPYAVSFIVVIAVLFVYRKFLLKSGDK